MVKTIKLTLLCFMRQKADAHTSPPKINLDFWWTGDCKCQGIWSYQRSVSCCTKWRAYTSRNLLGRRHAGFPLGRFHRGGAKSIVMQISFVMLLLSDQISGRGTNCLMGGAPLPLCGRKPACLSSVKFYVEYWVCKVCCLKLPEMQVEIP